MEVSLPPQLDSFVQSKVATGQFSSTSDVVREALRLMEEAERTREEQLHGFNEELGRRLSRLDRGEFVEPEEAKARIIQLSREYRTRSR